ncbi:hypothetical protein NJ7G_0801 [Natrinema sp. J7-2]|nr:hypothetical protein NJ7G_0801 [Natrinema sp. J7-2]
MTYSSIRVDGHDPRPAGDMMDNPVPIGPDASRSEWEEGLEL